ncbi:MAG: hypothetical protein BWX80_00828 [Candidatus Hydrogenedentes bacterium ADurb.Bin101]|nr:MAG: hypothetical protein BWX80_00828 [Candidatus Hydrogenedentes bacterium ADurb.Bin101]
MKYIQAGPGNDKSEMKGVAHLEKQTGVRHEVAQDQKDGQHCSAAAQSDQEQRGGNQEGARRFYPGGVPVMPAEEGPGSHRRFHFRVLWAVQGQGGQALDTFNRGQAARKEVGGKSERPFPEQGTARAGIGRAQIQGHGFRHAVHTRMSIDHGMGFRVARCQEQIIGSIAKIHGLLRFPAQPLEQGVGGDTARLMTHAAQHGRRHKCEQRQEQHGGGGAQEGVIPAFQRQGRQNKAGDRKTNQNILAETVADARNQSQGRRRQK